MKDYFDLWIILRNSELDTRLLLEAFEATLRSRKTAKPLGIPSGLTEQFVANQRNISLWNTFISRNKLNANSLEDTVYELRQKLAYLFE